VRCSLGIERFRPRDALRTPPQVPSRLASNPAADDTRIVHSHRLELSKQQHTRHLASRTLARDQISLNSHLAVFRTSFLFFVRSISPFASDPLLSVPQLLIFPQPRLSNLTTQPHSFFPHPLAHSLAPSILIFMPTRLASAHGSNPRHAILSPSLSPSFSFACRHLKPFVLPLSTQRRAGHVIPRSLLASLARFREVTSLKLS
jgi:hypothetical protein